MSRLTSLIPKDEVTQKKSTIPFVSLFLSILLFSYFFGYWRLNDSLSSSMRARVLGAKENRLISQQREIWRLQSSLFTPSIFPATDSLHKQKNIVATGIAILIILLSGIQLEQLYGGAKVLAACTASALAGSVTSFYLVEADSSHSFGFVFAMLGMGVGCKLLHRYWLTAFLEIALIALFLFVGYSQNMHDIPCNAVALGAGIICGFLIPRRGESLSHNWLGPVFLFVFSSLAATSIFAGCYYSAKEYQKFIESDQSIIDWSSDKETKVWYTNESYGYRFKYPATWSPSEDRPTYLHFELPNILHFEVHSTLPNETIEKYAMRRRDKIIQRPDIANSNNLNASDIHKIDINGIHASFCTIDYTLVEDSIYFSVSRRIYFIPLKRKDNSVLQITTLLDKTILERQEKQINRLLGTFEAMD